VFVVKPQGREWGRRFHGQQGVSLPMFNSTQRTSTTRWPSPVPSRFFWCLFRGFRLFAVLGGSWLFTIRVLVRGPADRTKRTCVCAGRHFHSNSEDLDFFASVLGVFFSGFKGTVLALYAGQYIPALNCYS
jgi:hypothetical protein